jgi:HNH endonuclease
MVNESGYGMVRTDGRTKRRAHRVMCERYKGKITPGMLLHHKCRNRRCCNPEHLEMVTRAQHSALHRGNLIGRDGLSDRCGKGHQFTPENTYIRTGGARVCRKCANERIKDWKARHPDTQQAQRIRYQARLKIQNILASFGDPGWDIKASRLLAA